MVPIHQIRHRVRQRKPQRLPGRGAVRDGYIRKTPCADIRLPETSATVVRLLTPG
jgi:hypothetical protein